MIYRIMYFRFYDAFMNFFLLVLSLVLSPYAHSEVKQYERSMVLDRGISVAVAERLLVETIRQDAVAEIGGFIRANKSTSDDGFNESISQVSAAYIVVKTISSKASTNENGRIVLTVKANAEVDQNSIDEAIDRLMYEQSFNEKMTDLFSENRRILAEIEALKRNDVDSHILSDSLNQLDKNMREIRDRNKQITRLDPKLLQVPEDYDSDTSISAFISELKSGFMLSNVRQDVISAYNDGKYFRIGLQVKWRYSWRHGISSLEHDSDAFHLANFNSKSWKNPSDYLREESCLGANWALAVLNKSAEFATFIPGREDSPIFAGNRFWECRQVFRKNFGSDEETDPEYISSSIDMRESAFPRSRLDNRILNALDKRSLVLLVDLGTYQKAMIPLADSSRIRFADQVYLSFDIPYYANSKAPEIVVSIKDFCKDNLDREIECH